MSTTSPPVDGRSAAALEARLVELLAQFTAHPAAPLHHYAFAPWKEFDPVTGKATGASAALVGIAVRFAEIAIDRINRAPDKNFLAFLDLLGAELQPPQAARVPLTFTLAAGSTVDAEVPAGTQVAAPPPPGRKDPVVFETERPLLVTAARLTTLLTVNPDEDTLGDWSPRPEGSLPAAPSTPSAPFAAFTPFTGDHAVEHLLYLGDDLLLGNGRLRTLSLDVGLVATLPADADARRLAWERWDGTAWQFVPLLADGSGGLLRSGRIGFDTRSPFVPASAGGVTASWLRCRLLTPVTRSPQPQAGMVRSAMLPVVASLALEATVARDPKDGLLPDAGFANGAPLDLSKEFLPFGDKPKRYDTLLLASAEAFSRDRTAHPALRSADIELAVTIANPAGDAAGSVKASTDLELTWECWNGQAWQLLGRSGPKVNPPADTTLRDDTAGLTKTGTVRFTLPDAVPRLLLNGQDNHWLRVRITQGDYGLPARYELIDPAKPEAGYKLTPETFRPPVLTSIAIGYVHTLRRAPQSCLACNALAFDDRSAAAAAGGAQPFMPFAPFVPVPEVERPTLYLGFELPPGRSSFPSASLSLYHRLAVPRYGLPAVPLDPETSTLRAGSGPTVTHHYTVTNDGNVSDRYELSVLGWRWPAVVVPAALDIEAGGAARCSVTVQVPDQALPGDSDGGFLRLARRSEPGVVHSVRFETRIGAPPAAERPGLAWQAWDGTSWAALTVQDEAEAYTRSGLVEFVPPRLVPRELFGRRRHWVRVAWRQGAYEVPPRLARVQLNTMTARQTSTVTSEILGSSNGAQGQVFRSTRAPVLAGQALEVREAELPGAEEAAALRREEGEDAITVVPDAQGQPRAIWVRWHEVPDFYGSSPRDRHYVINHLTGEIRFGDSVNGLIPPRGNGNLRLRRYQTGGGSLGNCAAGTINQLKTTVPYVDKAANADPAAGGAEAETTAELLQRMPRTLRHRDRAVTPEDFEDLALLATTEVVRARCVPLTDLRADAVGNTAVPGCVSLVIVPRSADVKPLPTLELLDRVAGFLQARMAAGVRLSVVGPAYIRVGVQAEVALTVPEGASAVERAVRERLAAFLHPLTGGLAGTGWDFGRSPHRSDFYALIESVPGVDHVRFLQLDEVEDEPGVRGTGRFLVFSGTHQIRVTYVEG